MRAPGVVPPDLIEAAKAEIGKPLDDTRVADRIAEFLLAAHARRHATKEAANG